MCCERIPTFQSSGSRDLLPRLVRTSTGRFDRLHPSRSEKVGSREMPLKFPELGLAHLDRHHELHPVGQA